MHEDRNGPNGGYWHDADAVRQPPQLGSKRTKTQNNRREPICYLGLSFLILYTNRKNKFFSVR